MQIRAWLNKARKALKNSEAYKADSDFFINDILFKLIDEFVSDKEDIKAAEYEQLNTALEELIKGKPLALILNYTYFYNHKIKVNEDVLIPRPDSETLVDTVKYYLPYLINKANLENRKLVLLEIGVGSGALSIAIADVLLNDLKFDNFIIFASDISQASIDLARYNIEVAGFSEQIKLDLCDIWPEKVKSGQKPDLIFSNPPYISAEELAQTDLLKYEPESALLAADNGLEFYERIFSEADALIKTEFLLVFEHGYKQKQAIETLAAKKPRYKYIDTVKDLAQRDRVSVYLAEEKGEK